jgi:hypothetical protein
MEPSRPAVSRETRLLLTIVLISLSMLWVLARIRFPGRPSTPNPVAPVLAQLAPPSALEDIASAVAQLTPRLEGILTPVDVQARTPALGARPVRTLVAAMRVADGVAVALTGDQIASSTPASGAGLALVAQDAASRLAVFKVPADDQPELPRWSPRGLQYPRFLIAADVSRDGASLRPVFIGSLDSIVSPLWDGPIWAVPDHTDLHDGAFLFTIEGDFAGVASERDGRLAIVPAGVVVATATRVMQQGSRPPGWIGVEVQSLTQPLAAAIGSNSGAVVAWVDPQGPAAGVLAPTDIIEQIEGTPVVTLEYWERRMAGLAAGDTLRLAVRHGADRREVRVIAGRPPDAPARWPLGLNMRSLPRVGVEILRVDPGSAGSRSGLRSGDVITIAGDLEAPTAGQLARLFAAEPATSPVLIVIARGDAHHVAVLEKKP